MVEGKKNLPGEADIQKIKRYIERTHIPKRVLQYRNASVKDLRAMMDFSDSVGVLLRAGHMLPRRKGGVQAWQVNPSTLWVSGLVGW